MSQGASTFYPCSKQFTMYLLPTTLVNFECWRGVKWAGADIFNSPPFCGPLVQCFHLSYCFTKYLMLPPMFLLAQFEQYQLAWYSEQRRCRPVTPILPHVTHVRDCFSIFRVVSCPLGATPVRLPGNMPSFELVISDNCS